MERRKKNLFARIRQLGRAHFSVTLSCAKVLWLELIKLLKLTHDKVEITLDEAANLSNTEKHRLVREDPSTTFQYFNRRVSEQMKMLFAKDGPFGTHTPSHYYLRVEFQHRGSPQVHIILWLRDKPDLDPLNQVTFPNILDSIVTCHPSTLDDPELVRLQTHRHTHTCKKHLSKQQAKTRQDHLLNACRFSQ